MRKIALALSLLLISACATTGSNLPEGTISVAGDDDQMEATIVVSSHPFRKQKFTENADVFARAVINKESRSAVAYQIYVDTKSSDWMRWRSITALVDGKPRTKNNASKIHSDVTCSQYGCVHIEHYGFVTSRQELETLARQEPLRMRINSNAGDLDLLMTGAEIVALLDRVDELAQ